MNNHAIKSGTIIGVIGIVISLLLYIVDATLYANIWLMLLLGGVNLGLVAFFGVKYRNEIGGELSFKDAYLYSLQAIVLLVIIGTVFAIVLFTIIDPGLPEIIADASVENTEAMMQKFGAPTEGMDDALDKAREDTLGRFTVGGLAKGGGIRILINLLFCLITGAIIKKNPPEETV